MTEAGPCIINQGMRKWNESKRILMDDNRIRSLFAEGKTCAEIAELFNCSTFPVKKAMRRLGLHRKAARRIGQGSGPKNAKWRGGRRVRSDGYVAVWTPEGERAEHQLVMESHLGRPLTDGEIVHHHDRNRQNNRIENLVIMTPSEHAREHADEVHEARYQREKYLRKIEERFIVGLN